MWRLTKVKICGLKTIADVQAVNDAQPELAGFVFAQSKRQVTATQAANLRAQLDSNIDAVGVFVNPTLAEIKPLLSSHTIQLVQIHGQQNQQLVAQLRQLGTKVIQAIQPGEQLKVTADYVMYDGRKPGSGTTIDWQTIDEEQRPFFLAGGLTPDNIETAITTVLPDFVDVSSGVETDGHKDAMKIMKFTWRAHNARNKIRN